MHVNEDALVLSVDADSDVVLRRATEQFLLRRRERASSGPFSVVYQDRRRVTVSRWTLNLGLYLFLLSLLFVPGIIYAGVARTKPASPPRRYGIWGGEGPEPSLPDNDYWTTWGTPEPRDA